MKKYCLLLIIQLLFTSWCMAQYTLKGKVTDVAGKPLEGVSVSVGRTRSLTASDGSFQLSVHPGNRVNFSFLGYQSFEWVAKEESLAPLVIQLKDSFLQEIVLTAAISPTSTWVGAKVGYNLDGDASEEYFGAAKIVLNAIKNPPRNWNIAVVGNFGNFITKLNTDDGRKGVTDLALTLTGLSVGVAGIYRLWSKEASAFRLYYLPAYRLNTYKNVGADSATVNISQFRNSVGVEFEGFELTKGGKVNISAEASLAFMDKGRYNHVFKEEKGSLASLDLTVILPISSQIGFFVDATFIQGNKPNYITGIILKP